MTLIPLPSPLRLLLLIVVLAGGAALSYEGWLGWDRQYDIDPVTGNYSGPYQAWQVVGCVLTIAVLATGAGLLRRPGLAVAVVPVVFMLLWSRDAARTDDSGMWAIGAIMLAFGSLSGVAAVACAADGVRRWRQSAARGELTRP